MKDITGNRYGKLVVVKRVGKIGAVQLIECVCDCGNKTIVRYPNLTSGTTTSCGCVKKQKTSERRMKNIVGKQFGELTVLSRASEIGKDKILWNCKCSCGRTCVVAGSNLKTGNTTSCGCMKASINESIIIRVLNEHNIRFDKEVKFPDLLSYTGNPLRFDFKIYTKTGSFLLEYQGLQHFQDDHVLFGRLSREYSDKKKKEYCQKNNIALEEISYKQDTEESLLNILNKYNLIHDNTVPSIE